METSSQKIPIVVYKNQPQDARLYFSDIYNTAPKVHKNESSNMDREEYKKIVKILSENNRRIRYLDQLAIMDQW